MQFLSVFLDITKIADICGKNAYISRNQIYTSFGSPLGKI